MAQHYSNPKRANDPGALPDIETFPVLRTGGDVTTDGCPICCGIRCAENGDPEHDEARDSRHNALHVGWYWQSCTPGCLPDGEPSGPFATEQEALDDARDGIEQ